MRPNYFELLKKQGASNLLAELERIEYPLPPARLLF